MEDATELELIPATPLAAVAQRKSGSELRAKAVFKAMEKCVCGCLERREAVRKT